MIASGLIENVRQQKSTNTDRTVNRNIALVSMPWGSALRPSLALATLKEVLRMERFSVDLQLLNMFFAEKLGVSTYETISSFSYPPTEWFFSHHLFGTLGLRELQNGWSDLLADERAQDLLDAIRESVNRSDELCQRIALQDVPWFMSFCMMEVDWSKYLAVGFTTTFAQSLASLALAKQIKDSYPHVNIVFGGANVDDEMGVEFLKGFPWIDYVVHGEAEKSFPALLNELSEGKEDVGVAGVSLRRKGRVIAAHCGAQPLSDLNESPLPDYSDFVGTAKTLGWHAKPRLYFETSRGCWWGAKHHCTFCGLNGSTMAFRKKSGTRVFDEILQLATKYRCLTLSATDNILAMDYFKDLLPRLASCDIDLQIFFEVKANMHRDHVKALKAAGINEVQPGIESLNSRVLELMRKGCTAIQNIQFLKWCFEYGILPNWNLLYGFPGETPEDYADLDEVFRLLMHLNPPSGFSPIYYERFSPYFFDREKFGLKLRPSSTYRFLYPESRVDLSKIAYFFDGEDDQRLEAATTYMQPAKGTWEKWQACWKARSVYCYFEKGPGYMFIHDNRPSADGSLKPRHLTLTGMAADIYLFCDEHRSFRAIRDWLAERGKRPEDERTLQTSLDNLVQSRVMFREGDRYLSLAVRKTTPAVDTASN